MTGGEDPKEFAAAECREVASLLAFYACEETNEAESARVAQHLAVCAACSEQLWQERAFLESLNSTPQPADQFDSSGLLLAQCRSELSEKLDDLHAPHTEERWSAFGWMRRWMALRPLWSGAVLVFFGVLVGTQIVPWLQTANDVAGPAVNVLAAPKLSDEQLSKMAIAGIRVSPAQDASTDNIQLHLNAEQPLVLTGNVDDRDVRRVLTYVVENGERFDPGVRLDCLDALKFRTADQAVRQTLLSAARNDQNAAVRMKALESLRDTANDDAVRQTMLQILAHDPHPGVRIEAVNFLVRSLDSLGQDYSETPIAEPELAQIVRVLTDLEQKDPSHFVRLRSGAALRQIASRDLQ
jgi:HEAT repeats